MDKIKLFAEITDDFTTAQGHLLRRLIEEFERRAHVQLIGLTHEALDELPLTDALSDLGHALIDAADVMLEGLTRDDFDFNAVSHLAHCLYSGAQHLATVIVAEHRPKSQLN